MKRILGLDLGTNSIGWALVDEAENENETSKIIKLGVRVNPLTVDEKTNFEKGKPTSVNADRTLKRGARRNLQRFKLRRKELFDLLQNHQIINDDFILAEDGKNSTHQTIRLRAKAAREKIELDDLAKVFFAINKKRGYKSSRKTKIEEDGTAVDGMLVAKHLYDNGLTPGQYVLELLAQNKKYIPDFYQSDLQEEFNRIWNIQKEYYPEILSISLFNELQNKNKGTTWTIIQKATGIVGKKLEGNATDQKFQRYQFRAKGLTEKLDLEHLAIALQEINNDKNKSSGYLGSISDRSKILYINSKTVGEFLWEQLSRNPNTSLKNQVFYRQDYLDEFELIWGTQSQFYQELTKEFKEEVRDTVIFYQRKLKSQKGLIGFCQFESWQIEKKDNKGNPIINKYTKLPKRQTVGHRVIPKSSPLFQEFKIWQNLNVLQFKNEETKELIEVVKLDEEIREAIFNELNVRGNQTSNYVLKLLARYLKIGKTSLWKSNLKIVEGNRTNQALYKAYLEIAKREGYGFDWTKKSIEEIKQEVIHLFKEIGVPPNILEFDANLEGNDFDKQASYQLWHLIYAAEDDDKVSEEDRLVYGNSDINLKKKLRHKFGFPAEYAKLITNVSLSDDYGNLSSRAIKKIIPHLQAGHIFSEACALVGYNHSQSLNKEELKNRILKERLEILSKNSLRNPVVEKILNQMVNLVNQVCDTYGKPKEIRIELARELKKSASEREEATKGIAAATKKNDEIRAIILSKFGFTATRNDVIRYKLWQELAANGHKTLFTNQYIPEEKVFSKDVDIEHIIPKALLFDDSFSNKTLAYREVNLKKADRTAFDFISSDYNSNLETYIARVERLSKDKVISKSKHKKLLLSALKLPDGFIERDLRNSQYIAKKAKDMLSEVFENVIATSGSITDKLREDWDLINVMKELNLPKYRALGLTELEKRWDSGQEKYKEVEIIKNWTKRNDHRHHAMDALTVAFTTHSHIQYINYLNARRNEQHKKHGNILAIQNSITEEVTRKNGKKRRRFKAPIQNFRTAATKEIEAILISFKTKNKVVTRNVNTTKTNNGRKAKIQLTPRGQLHKETVYARRKRAMTKPIKLNKKFTLEKATLIIHAKQKALVLNHLASFENNPAVAFDAKTLKKNPLVYKNEPLKEVFCFEELFTIRKPISPELKLDKVVDEGVKEILKARLAEFDGKPKEAFSDLEKNPIWLNKEKGIAIKRVTITGVSNAEPLHIAKNHLGEDVLDSANKVVPVDFVSTGNNHHVAIYRDTEGKLQERVVSFYEAVTRVQENMPIIDKTFNAEIGWEFLFTLKQNELFVFPSEDFNPQEIDLIDEKKLALISKHLFRVQKISSKDYLFSHHLETQATTGEDMKKLKVLIGKKYYYYQTPAKLEGLMKVRVNHIGEIVQVGEY